MPNHLSTVPLVETTDAVWIDGERRRLSPTALAHLDGCFSPADVIEQLGRSHARELRAELGRTTLAVGLADHPIPPVVRDSGAGTVTLGPDPELFERHRER